MDQLLKLNNGVSIPRVALGVFRMEEDESAAAVRAALECGYRHLDTAAAYHNEAGVGRGIKESGVKREDIFLTTKLWNDDMRAHRVRAAFEDSLKALGTDYVDLYLIHWPVAGEYVAAWKEMESLYKEGRIRAIGVSNFHVHHLEDVLAVADVVPAVNQIEMHPLLTQGSLRAWCQERGIAIEAWSPLGGVSGALLSHPVLAAIAAKYGKSIAQVIIRWDLQSGIITLPKSSNPERMKANLAVWDFELTCEDMAAIDVLNAERRVGPDPETFDF